ncbi:hypothetical protein HHK36_005928 [Tetracentron sinense]|uniref:DUF1677 family protein n=1 Tax=Tetracentron sinense TaxID=13715 RepID=A0A834ZQY3_TETSI|nr:hypothetical protein HHK36_005928 [Tetracentron sinense]
MTISGPESQPAAIKISSQIEAEFEFEFVTCDSCGLTEECTPEYINRVRERYRGRWVCGLCAEAVKDEIIRSKRIISTEEALDRHMNFCKKFRSLSPTSNQAEHLISAMRHLFRRSMDSPRSPSSPLQKQGQVRPPSFVRSETESCFPT